MSTALIIISAIASGSIWLWFIRRYDRIEPEHLKILLWVSVCGGFLSAFCASLLELIFVIIINYDLAQDQGNILSTFIFTLFVGIVEESMKLLFTIWFIYKKKYFNEPVDAIIYSMTVALGFAFFENIGYAIMYGNSVILLRSVTAVPMHLFVAVIWGYGLAKAKFIFGREYIKVIFPYLAVAAVIHGLYNFAILIYPSLAVMVFASIFIMYKRGDEKIKYLANQSPFLQINECPKCGKINPKNSKLCKKCGFSLVKDFALQCNECKKNIYAEDKYCSHCGATIEENILNAK